MRKIGKKTLAALKKIEDSGAGFWDVMRNKNIVIYVRGINGNDPNQWANAQAIERFFGMKVVNGITIDALSGTLVIEIKR